MRALLGLLLTAVLLCASTHAAASASRCRRVLIRAAAKLTVRAQQALVSCEDQRLARGTGADCELPPATVPGTLARAVAGACGGRDGRCGTADDPALSAIGWGGGEFTGIGPADALRCGRPIESCADVVAAIGCVAASATTGLHDYYADVDQGAGKPATRCARTIGRIAVRRLGEKARAVVRCELGGGTAEQCRTTAARARHDAALCRACGGHDHSCDGVDDVPAAIAYGGHCPAGDSTGGTSCEQPLGDARDVAACVECLTAPASTCALAVAGGGTPTPPPCRPPTTTTTTLPPCCGAVRMRLESVEGGSFSIGPFVSKNIPSGLRLTVDMGPADATCRHDLVVPPGGFEQPAFCLAPFSYSERIFAEGCAAGAALGRGVAWDGGAATADPDTTIVGDTTDGICNPGGEVCSADFQDQGGANLRGAEQVHRGDGTPNAPGMHLAIEMPVNEIAWSRAGGTSCIDADNSPEGDSVESRTRVTARLTTGTAALRFEDLNGDTCAVAGFAPHEASASGRPGGSACCTPGDTLELAAATPIYGTDFGDLTSSLHLPMRVTACEPWPGPGPTCDALVGGGRVVTSFGPNGDGARAVMLLSDGRFVVGGSVRAKQGTKDFIGVGLVRYLADGRIDTTFGRDGDGRVFYPIDLEPARSMAFLRQPDGKLVVVVNVGAMLDRVPIGPPAVRVLRFDAEGNADTGFGVDGRVDLFDGAVEVEMPAIVRQSNGRLVLGGWSGFVPGTRELATLVALGDDGTLDDSFGDHGIIQVHNIGAISALAVTPADELVALGRIILPGTQVATYVARFDVDGTPDDGFGAHGVFTLPEETAIGTMRIVLAPDGEIVLGYMLGGSDRGFRTVVDRLAADGSGLITGFGENGQVALAPFVQGGGSLFGGLVRAPDGNILLAGAVQNHTYAVRLLPSGAGDATFGNGGITQPTFGGKADGADALALQPDGRILVAGSRRQELFSNDGDIALARFLADGRLDPTFNGDECRWPVHDD